MLQDTIERQFVQNLYADVERGLFLVRGENVLLLGEIVCYSMSRSRSILMQRQDLDKDDDIPEPFQLSSAEIVFDLKKQDDQNRKQTDKSKLKKLAEFGFEGEHAGEALF